MTRSRSGSWPCDGGCVERLLLRVVVALVVILLPALACAAPGPVYSIVIGQNSIAPSLQGDARGLVTLRYADDDAFKFFSLMEHASRRAFLLSVPDADTQRRFPQLIARAASPTLAELERVVAAVVRAMTDDRAKGEEPELVFFFSGHGLKDEHGGASLSLLDAALTRAWLYERLLAAIPARFVHLLIDACHAEALVRPRDANAQMETLEEAERAAYVDAETLARFPHVGAVLAATANAQSFEWDGYRGGVFAHQLLSGLRGGADVNGDGLVEYSEIAAFLSAANLHVRDARAQLQIVVRAPPLQRRAPLMSLSHLAQQFELRGRAEGAWSKGFFVETAAGERLVDVFPEPATPLALRLPRGQRLYLVWPDQEVEIPPQSGGTLLLSGLRGRPPRAQARGSLDTALREGLFRARYGPAFYAGYVSQRDDLVAVPMLPEPSVASQSGRETPASTPPGQTSASVAKALLVGSGIAAIATGVTAGLMLKTRGEYLDEPYEHRAYQLRGRFYVLRTIAAVSGGVTIACAGTSLALFALPTSASARPSASTRPSPGLPDGVVIAMNGAF